MCADSTDEGICDDGDNGFESGSIGGGSGSAQGTAADAVSIVMMLIILWLVRVLWEDGIQT